jgi:hypothetical protein
LISSALWHQVGRFFAEIYLPPKFRAVHGDSMFLLNVCIHLPDYLVS